MLLAEQSELDQVLDVEHADRASAVDHDDVRVFVKRQERRDRSEHRLADRRRGRQGGLVDLSVAEGEDYAKALAVQADGKVISAGMTSTTAAA